MVESAAYCNQILQLYPKVHKNVGLFDHSADVITFMFARSDPIKGPFK